jgi:hypothetical protein
MRYGHIVLGEQGDLLLVDLDAVRCEDVRAEQVVGRKMADGSEARGRNLADR